MTYLVTARKWRPMLFDDIVGQSHVATTLRNAIGANRLSHAYLFGGPRGVGKTTTARILAKAINCLHPVNANPDNECELCREITEGRSVNVFEIDGASNRGVDEIRNLRESVRYAPASGKFKVYIIDEVHMLTKEAFNALLKTLEEPPPYVIFIFATTEIHKVPATILSRCQRFDFRRIPLDEITSRLRFIAGAESITIDDEALFLIARRGDGSMRDAQSIFDQVISFTGTTVTAADVRSMLNLVGEDLYFSATGIIRSKDVKAGLELIESVINDGHDLREFLNGLTEHLRNLLVARATGSSELIESSEEFRKRYRETAASFTETDLLRLITIATATDAALKWSQRPRIRLELGFVQMIRLDSSVEITSLLSQLASLEQRLGNDQPVLPPASAPTPAAGKTAAVRGSVKATPPTLRPDQIVEPDIPPMRGEPEAEAMTIAGDSPDVSKWSALIEEAGRLRIAVGTILEETTLIGIQGNRLKIGCRDNFHLDALSRNRTFITDVAQKIFGPKIQLETVLSTQAAAPQGTVPAPPQGNPMHEHPLVQALIREFGAREVH